MKIQYVPLTAVHSSWGNISPFIEAALEHSNGDYTIDQAKVYISTGEWLALVAVDADNKVHGAAAVKFYNRPNDRVAFVVAMSGNLITSPETFEQLKGYCVSNGATVIEGTARESTARLWTRYGFTEKCRIVGARL
jgi:hypothetical protein